MTLFPFLAVLVCTMGALILLLLVTTRQIRNQAAMQAAGAILAEESAVPFAAVDDDADHPDPPPFSVPSEEETEPEELAAFKSQRDDEEQERRKRHQVALSERKQRQEQLDAQWRERLTRLREEQEELIQERHRLRVRIETESTELDQLDEELDWISELLADIDEQEAKLERWEHQLEESQQEIREQIERLTRQIETARSQQRFQPPPLQIVAFDPTTGTERKPILIECRSDSLVFASEGVPITAVELSGFTPDYNPLKAGADALVEYWSRQERLDPGNSAKPYVLLVVRPGGTVGFYVARKMLEKLDHDFGYELVRADDDFEWPERDPEAARVCRDAVRRMLAERERLASNLSGGRYPLAGVLRFAGRDGEFHLQEIDELRNTDEEGLFIGGKKWVPPKRGEHRTSPDPSGRNGDGLADARGQRSVSPSHIDLPSGSGRDGSGRDDTRFRGGRQYTERRRSHPPLDSPEVHPLLSTDGRSGSTGSQRMDRETDSPRSLHDSGDRDLARNQSDSSLRPNQNGLRSDESRRIVSPNRSGDRSVSEFPTANEPGDSGDVSSPDWSSMNRARSAQDPSSGGAGPAGAARPPQRLQPAQSTPLGQRQSSASGTIGQRHENDDPARRWSDDGRNGTIGIEREVTLHVWADRVQVGEEQELEIPPERTREELQQQVASALKTHVLDWGAAPEAFFWKPALKFIIHPGGNQHYSRLSQLADQWELKKRVEYDLQ